MKLKTKPSASAVSRKRSQRCNGEERGAQFPGRRITMGAPRSSNYVTSTFFNTVYCFRKSSGSNMRAPNLLLAPATI